MNEIQIAVDLIQVLAMAGRQIINDAHPGAIRSQRRCDVRSNKSGAAGN